MTIEVALPDDLVKRIDRVARDRSPFVAMAVRNLLRDSEQVDDAEETARIDRVADELNREAADVLEYQVNS